jgi:DNA replication protein DnaC
MSDPIHPDLVLLLKRLKLGRLLDTLPERLALARQQKMPHQDFLRLLLSDEVSRRDSLSTMLRAQRAKLDAEMQLENWDATANVTYDQTLVNELASLRFLEARRHVTIVGPVGVGKTFFAHALGHIACRRGCSVLAVEADQMLKDLTHARLDRTYEAEIRKLLAVDLLIIDDFGVDALDADQGRDIHEIFTERHRAGSVIVTSNRGPDEWIATFPDPLRAQAAIDRFTSNSFDLVIEGESYRQRLKPKWKAATAPGHRPRSSVKSTASATTPP